MQKRDFETYQKRFRDFEILLKFPRCTFFEVPFATPYFHLLAFLNYPLCFTATLTDKKLMIIIIKSKENEEC